MSGPLTGIRVVDFGRFIAAPYCATLFADWGADVIRVERRAGGEDRFVGPVTPAGDGGLFLNLNRNKRGMTLELGQPSSQTIVDRLIAWADVVVVNLPPDALRAVGLEPARLQASKPELIIVTATAFGADGPHANKVGFDTVAQATSGAMSLTGFPGPPMRSLVPFADYGTALHAGFGALAALLEKQRTGRGRIVEVSLLSTCVMFMAPFLAERSAVGVVREQRGNASLYTAPSDAYPTKDGWIVVATIGEAMFARWLKLVGRPELRDDPRFRDDLSRADHYEAITEIMTAWTTERTNAEALAELERARLPAAPVQRLAETLADPQVQARELLAPVDAASSPNPIPIARSAIRLDGAKGADPRPAPAIGEHTDAILSELGFSAHEIAAFRAASLV